MNMFIKRTIVPTGLFAVLLVAVMTYQAAAIQAAGRPSVVVTVNLATVLEKLDQRAAAEASLKQMVDSMNAEKESREQAIEKMREKHKNMADGPEKQALENEILLANRKFEAWARFTVDKLDIEEALLYHDLYRSIKSAAAQLAEAAKYDLVLVDDSQGELSTTAQSRVSRKAQILQQIASRRMLHVNPAIDITDELVMRMNNEFKSRKP